MFGLRLRRRREQLARALAADPFARPGWQPWLDAAGSIRELHASCPEPGWRIYCAYFEEVRQDPIVACALACARLAASHDPEPIVSTAEVERWSELAFPDLCAHVVGLERRYPLARPLIALLQTPFCFAIADLDRLRVELNPAPEPGGEASPFRSDPDADTRETLDALVAAGFAAAMLCIPLRHEGLRDAVTTHAAAAATLLTGSYAEYRDDALAAVRERL